jgi:flagellin-like protein
MYKRGLSGVVTAVLLVLLAIALVAIVWTVVSNLIEKRLEETSCLDTVGEVGFNHQYICYNSSSKELRFAISIGDIDIKMVSVSVSGDGSKKSFEILNESSTVAHLWPYGGSDGDPVVLPGKGGGLSYYYNMSAANFSERPDSIEIFPVIAGNTCAATDSIREIVDCYALT